MTSRQCARSNIPARDENGPKRPPRAVRSIPKPLKRLRSYWATGRAGALEAVKFPREGAGLLSSLVDTDGLVELGEQVTLVEPGQTVGFLSYASLM